MLDAKEIKLFHQVLQRNYESWVFQKALALSKDRKDQIKNYTHFLTVLFDMTFLWFMWIFKNKQSKNGTVLPLRGSK